jgi:hypothetical protein
MPVVNVRNDEQAVLLDTEFIRKQDHLYIAGILPGLLQGIGGAREMWIFNRATIDVGNNPVFQGLIRDEVHSVTLTGAPAALTVPNADDIISRHGWLAKTRLGEVNGFHLFAPSTINNQLTGIENHVLPANRGASAFVAFYLPATAVPPIPGAGNQKLFFSKWNEDTVNQRAWTIEWYNTAGVIRFRVALSVDGAGVQTFTATTFNFVPGNSYCVGFSFIPSTSVTLFFNDQFETRVLDDLGAAVPASIFASTANVCVARRDTTAAGTILASPDAQYLFAGLSSLRWSSAVGLAFYRFVQPVLLYNTNLSST